MVSSVHFPGAVNSKFTTDLTFEQPSTHPAMPTYRVMDSDGIIVDESRKPSDISNEEILKWYKNMLTGTDPRRGKEGCDSRGMLKGLCQGNSQHYGSHHVRCAKARPAELLHGIARKFSSSKNGIDVMFRSPQAKKASRLDQHQLSSTKMLSSANIERLASSNSVASPFQTS